MVNRSLILLFLLLPFPALSAVVVQPVVAGYNSVAKTYTGAAAVAANSGFAGEGIINVGGRAMTFPASMRIAANAGQYAVSAVRMNPGLLALSAVAAWLLPYGLEWIDGQWKRVVPESSSYIYTIPIYPGVEYQSWGNLCTAWRSYWKITTTYPDDEPTMKCGGQYGLVTPSGAAKSLKIVPETTEPATDADFVAPASAPLPDPVADQLADAAPNPVPVPVESPQIAPQDIPSGDPYTKPDGSTVQPMARITPNPDGSVTVDLYERPIASPDGTPITDGAPIDTPEPPPDPCDEHPDRAGCADLGEPDDDKPLTREESFTYTPESPVFSGSCPSPISIVGQSLSFQPACDAMTMIRPLILGLASLMAGYILIGAFRET